MVAATTRKGNTMTIKQRINRRLRFLRVRLALAIFPKGGWHIVANRFEYAFETPKVECRFIVRNKTKRDGYSWGEMIGILDVFLGRQATDQEWRELLSWKNRPEKEAA
jgi:hypothetical protein